jgi:hypothetical protein
MMPPITASHHLHGPGRAAGLLVLALLVWQAPARAQTGGSSEAAVAGTALGAMAGATFATIGAILPCTQTYSGPSCVRSAAIVGTVVGLGSGMAIGSASLEEVERMATGAAVGFVVGGGIGLALKQVILYSTWGDVVAAGVVGASVGTSPIGALVGLGAGTVAGLAAWQLFPAFDLVNAAEFSVAGLALGGIASLLYRAFDAQAEDSAPTVTLPIRIRF